MPVNLNGLIFGQIMPDNSGGAEFDSDLDGATTQEDEFISFTNTTGAPLDISGWQVWSVSTGTGALDAPTSGLYHTFPPGTVVAPGDTLYVINEISGPVPSYAQEASSGGVQSGAGGVSTNLLTEGNSGTTAESIALRDPATGQYIIFNMSSVVPTYTSTSPPGFPAATSTQVGIINGHAVQDDPAAGFSYQYNAATDSYIYAPAFIPCFAAGTLIDTPQGQKPIETLKIGDLVLTADDGPQPILWVGQRRVDFTAGRLDDKRPVEFKPGSLGPNLPQRPLVVSPQHRLLLVENGGRQVLAPAIGLAGRRLVRVKQGVRSVTYHHILLAKHAILSANGVPAESLFPSDLSISGFAVRDRLAILAHFPRRDCLPDRARPCLTVQQTLRSGPAALRPATGFSTCLAQELVE